MSQSQKKKIQKGSSGKAGSQRVRLDLAAAERKAELLLGTGNLLPPTLTVTTVVQDLRPH